MSDVALEAVKQVPALAVLCGLVAWVISTFIKYLAKRDAEFAAIVSKLNQDNLAAREASRGVIEHCTNIIEKNAELRGGLSEVMTQLKGILVKLEDILVKTGKRR